jgi:hypothetical protein
MELLEVLQAYRFSLESHAGCDAGRNLSPRLSEAGLLRERLPCLHFG